MLNRMYEKLKSPVALCLLALFCNALWGSAFPFIKIGYEQFAVGADQTGTQILFAGVRFAIAGLMTVAIGSISQRKLLVPRASAIPKVLTLALLQTVVQYVFFYIGLAHTTGVKASIINGSGVFLSILAASLLFRMEKLTTRKIVGCVVGFLGVVLINLAQGGVDFNFAFVGEGFIIISASSYALSSAAIKRFSQTENPVMLSGWQFFAGGILMVLLGMILGGRLTVWTLPGILDLLYLAFVSAASYSLWGMLLKVHPLSKVAVFGFANPVFGVLLSAVLLGEQQSFGWTALASLMLVSAGIAIVYSQKKEKKA